MNIRGEISLLCKYLKKYGYIDWRPDSLEIPANREYRQDKHILQRNEVAYILKDETEDFYLMAWQMMLVYGFRPGEVYGLQWVDIDNEKITINRSIDNKGQVTPGKNKNARRFEYITGYARSLLDRVRALQKKRSIISPWVFVNINGGPLQGQNSNHNLHDYCAKNNITDVSPYRLRHTFVSLAKEALTEAQLKLTLGHSATMDTGIYIHKLDDDHISTGKALDTLFDKLLG